MESYQRAVAQYKLAGDWDSAAMTLTKMADIFRRQGDLMGAGRLHGEAGACFRKHSAHEAVQAYLKVQGVRLEPSESYCLLLPKYEQKGFFKHTGGSPDVVHLIKKSSQVF